MTAGLTTKQQRFVDEYLIDLNATRAAIRAGYSSRTADKIGAQLLGKPWVAAAVQAAVAARQKRVHVTQDRVLEELARIAFFDIRRLYREDGKLKSPVELDDDSAAVLASIETVEEFSHESGRKELIGYTKKAKVWDKGAALALAMRHLGMLVDRTEFSGPNGQPLAPPVINLIRAPDAAPLTIDMTP